MVIAATWDQLRVIGMTNDGKRLPRRSRTPSVRGYRDCLTRVIAAEGAPAAERLYWLAKNWPNAAHLRAALPAELREVAA